MSVFLSLKNVIKAKQWQGVKSGGKSEIKAAIFIGKAQSNNSPGRNVKCPFGKNIP